MFRHLLPAALFILAMLATATAAGEFRPSETSAKASWFAHLNISSLRDSEIGKELINELDGEAKRQLRQLERMLNFHPIDDLDCVTVYGTSSDPEKAVALIRGKFDTKRLTGLAEDGDNYKATPYKTATIHSWTDNGNRIYATISSESLLILGPEIELVKIANDVTAGSAPGLDGAKIFGHANSVHHPILIASADLAALGTLDIDSILVRKIKSVYISAGEKGGELLAYAALKTADGRSAKLVDQMFHGVLAFAEASGEVPQEVIEAFKTEAGDDGISMTASLPMKQFKQLLTKLEKAAEGLQ